LPPFKEFAMFKSLSQWLGRFRSHKNRSAQSEELKIVANGPGHVWIGTVNTDWGNPKNWSNGLPSIEDEVKFERRPGQPS
jgi:hypothetical protein